MCQIVSYMYVLYILKLMCFIMEYGLLIISGVFSKLKFFGETTKKKKKILSLRHVIFQTFKCNILNLGV